MSSFYNLIDLSSRDRAEHSKDCDMLIKCMESPLIISSWRYLSLSWSSSWSQVLQVQEERKGFGNKMTKNDAMGGMSRTNKF